MTPTVKDIRNICHELTAFDPTYQVITGDAEVMNKVKAYFLATISFLSCGFYQFHFNDKEALQSLSAFFSEKNIQYFQQLDNHELIRLIGTIQELQQQLTNAPQDVQDNATTCLTNLNNAYIAQYNLEDINLEDILTDDQPLSPDAFSDFTGDPIRTVGDLRKLCAGLAEFNPKTQVVTSNGTVMNKVLAYVLFVLSYLSFRLYKFDFDNQAALSSLSGFFKSDTEQYLAQVDTHTLVKVENTLQQLQDKIKLNDYAVNKSRDAKYRAKSLGSVDPIERPVEQNLARIVGDCLASVKAAYGKVVKAKIDIYTDSMTLQEVDQRQNTQGDLTRFTGAYRLVGDVNPADLIDDDDD